MRTAAIALGSNLASRFGSREETLQEAVRRLGAVGEVLAVSRFHDTAPEINLDQPRFLNAVALLRTALVPEQLMKELLAVEAAMGRERAGVPAKGPRVIDLDLLLVDDLMSDSELLKLPHPAMAERGFVLEPLAELAPGWRHPRLGRTVAQMLRECTASAG